MTTKRPASLLREAFAPGDPVSLYEAAAILDGDVAAASQALTYLGSKGYVERVRRRLWVRAGAAVDPYRLGARVTSPYAFAYGTALALHGGGSAVRSEILVASPRRFESFEYLGLVYRRALPWPAGALAKIAVGPEFVWATTRERTLVDCVRVPSNAGGISEILRGLSGLGPLDSEEVLRFTDLYGEANLAGRLGFVLEASDLAVEGRLFYELERRRPQARVYLEPGLRGGTLARRWNVIVPEHLRRAPREPV